MAAALQDVVRQHKSRMITLYICKYKPMAGIELPEVNVRSLS